MASYKKVFQLSRIRTKNDGGLNELDQLPCHKHSTVYPAKVHYWIVAAIEGLSSKPSRKTVLNENNIKSFCGT